mgnify:CR=1 FL=1
MGFLAPLFLVGALTAAIPIVLHLLRREPEARVRFAAVALLRATPVEQADRRRLRQLLLLALRVAPLLALTLAFARPFLTDRAGTTAQGVTVVALDTSLSMSAPGYFARAQALARQTVQEAPRDHDVGIVAFATEATALAEPSGDRAQALRAIESARPGVGATRYPVALLAGAGMVAGRRGRIVVVTDGQATGWNPDDRVSLPEEVLVEVRDAGMPPPNLAVTELGATSDRIVATIRSTAPERRLVRARLAVDADETHETTGTVEPGGSVELVFPISARGVAVRVSIEDQEGLAGDNARFLVYDDASGPPVLVVTSTGDLDRDAFYVTQALRTGGAERSGFAVEGRDGIQVSAMDSAALRRYGAVFLLSTRGLDQRGRELLAGYIRDGGGLLLAAGSDVDADVAAGAAGGAVTLSLPTADPGGSSLRVLAPADLRHPVFRAFAANAATLGLVRFTRVAVLGGDDCWTIARFTAGEPALVECHAGLGRVLALASDLDGRWNDFPLHGSFLPFLHEVARHLVGERAQPLSYVVGSTPPGVPAEPGIIDVPGQDGRPPTRVAVNVDPRESDLARADPSAFQSAILREPSEASASQPMVARQQQEDRQRLWRYAIFGMILALVAESLLAARTS